jgi:hypothetical protein
MLRTVTLLALVGFTAVACQISEPMYEPRNIPIVAPPGATLQQVGQAIKQAGAGIGWQMMDQAPGFIHGKIAQRDLAAEINIQYDTKSFSITHAASSETMRASGGEVGPAYNRWIRNLEQKILAQTSAISVYPMAPAPMSTVPPSGRR